MVCDVIIDSESFENVVSNDIVEKLELATKSNSHPYKLHSESYKLHDRSTRVSFSKPISSVQS